MPSPGLRETPPRFIIKSGKLCWVSTSTGLGYAAVWQNDCITKSAEKPKHASSFSSSLVIGPVVSCDPTVVILGSQYVPGLTPSTPHAFPTIFCAKVKPDLLLSLVSGRLNTLDVSNPNASLLLSVNCLPIISGMRPLALTSSKITSVFNLNSESTSLVFASSIFPLNGSRIISWPINIFDTSISIGNAPESSRVLKKIGAIFPPKQ